MPLVGDEYLHALIADANGAACPILLQITTQAIANLGAGGGAPVPISNTLVANGAIAPADTLTVITGGTTFTLAAATDSHAHVVNNQSGANITVTLTLNDVLEGVLIASGSILRVSYQSTLSSYILV